MRVEESGPVQWRDVQMWLPVSDGHGSLDASYLAIHETAEPGATAADHIHHWTFNDSSYAVHYVADWESDTVYCAVPDDRLCWHVGSGNKYCVGIELCHATNQEDFERIWETGVKFAAWYLNMRGWGIDRLISHNDATNWWGGSDHTDPLEYFESYGESWEQFKTEVESAMSGQPQPKKVNDLKEVFNGGGEVYRLYNTNSGFHHYTISGGERDGLVAAGWNYEGVAWTAPKSAQDAVYRMYNPNDGDHYYSMSFGEVSGLQEAGWVYEGVSWFSKPGGTPVFCVYNPNSGEHLFTANRGEVDSLVSVGWRDQGAAFNY